MAIKELITIEGAEQVKKTIADLGKSGEDFIKKLNNVGTSNNAGLQSFFTGIQTGTRALNEHGRSVNEISATYHILNPLLRETGLGMIGFREWTMVARLGFMGLATAGIGAVITELFKLEDASKTVKQQLANILGPEGGKTLFTGLQQAAGGANTTVANLAEGAKVLSQAWAQTPVITGWVKQFNTVLDEYGMIVKQDLEGHMVPTGFSDFKRDTKDIPTILAAISQGMQAEGVKAADADKATATFLANIFKLQTVDLTKIPEMAGQLNQGFTKALDFQGVTSEMLAQFEKSAPLLSGIIEKHLTGGFTSVAERIANEGKISADEFAKAVVDSVPEIQAATAKIAPTFGQNFERDRNALERSLNNLSQTIEDSGKKGLESWQTITEGIVLNNQGTTVTLKQQYDTLWDNVVGGAQDAWSRIRNIFSNEIPLNIQGGLGGGSGIGGFASGGLFRGRGGTDNNIIAISDYEYILRPEAVRKYGVHLLDWINSLQMPVRGFASGGLVTPRPALAGGRLPSNNQRPFVLNIPGAGSFRGSIAAPDGVLESLSRASTFEQMTQGGRSPGWRR